MGIDELRIAWQVMCLNRFAVLVLSKLNCEKICFEYDEQFSEYVAAFSSRNLRTPGMQAHSEWMWLMWSL